MTRELLRAHHPQREFLPERFHFALLDLAHVVFFKAYLGPVHPFSGARPVGIARWNLRQGHERDAAVTKIRQAKRIPGRLVGQGIVFHDHPPCSAPSR